VRGAARAGQGTNDEPARLSTSSGLSWLQDAYVLTGVAGVGFFVWSCLVLAVWPNQVLERRIADSRPSELRRVPAAVTSGRAVYGREGCANCHTQLVRFTDDDVRRFGEPSQAWESDLDYPE